MTDLNDELLKKAAEKGAEIKYMVLQDFLFSVCEKFTQSFKPDNVTEERFLGFTIYSLNRIYKEKYPTLKEEDDQKKGS